MRVEDERTLAGLLLAIGVFIALVVPSVSHVFAPYLLHSLFFVVLFSLLPVARQNISDLIDLNPATLSLVLWQQFLLPGLAMVGGRAVGIDEQIMFFVYVVMVSGSLFSSPTLSEIMGLDRKMAIQAVVLSTLAAPVSILLAYVVSSSSAMEIDMAEFIFRVGIFLVLPAIILFLFRKVTSNLPSGGTQIVDRIARWGGVVSLMFFCFALEEPVSEQLAENPTKVLGFLAIAITVSVISALLTRLAMARFGAYAATTACVLVSFRNVGLTYGLVASTGHDDLAVFVGVCQIPMFFTPLIFDLLLGNSRAQQHKGSADAEPEPEFGGMPSNSPVPSPIAGVAAMASATAPQQSFGLHGMGGSTASLNRDVPGNAVSPIASMQNRSNHPMSSSIQATASAAALQIDPQDELLLDEDLFVPEQAIERLQEHHDEAEATATAIKAEVAEDRSAAAYVMLVVVLVVAGLAAIWHANKHFAPMLFDQSLIEQVAEAHIAGNNFGVYDLNINIRDLRNATIARMDKTPDVVVLGASQWQEGDVALLPDRNFYNSHIHRDYYEDMLAMVEMYVRHDKLPPEMIITIRDNLFTPVAERTDFLWLPGIKYYRAMAERLGMEPHSEWETLPVNTWRELLSMPLLWMHGSRDLTAPVKPHVTNEKFLETLDVLLPGGSIVWSGEHKRLFDQKRAREEALGFAERRRNDPPKIDPQGIEHLRILLQYLQDNNVSVTLAHPPFNPLYWDAVQDSPYMDGLRKVEQVTRDLADEFGLAMIGGYDPKKTGCTADQYIDAEHANSTCLGWLLQQYARLSEPAASHKPIFASDVPLRGSIGSATGTR